MKRSLSLLASLLFLMVGVAAFGQTATLGLSSTAPVIDGVVNPGEYSFTRDFGRLTVYVNRTSDALSIAVVGSTTGWVAVGLGSLKMDGATLFMGFVGADGKVQLKTQSGRGHMHGDAPAAVSDTIISSAMKEANGKTVLEISLKPSAYIAAGQTTLNLIVAQGGADSFFSMHTFNGTLSLDLAK